MKNISLEISTKCNISCKYCILKENKSNTLMELNIAEKIMESHINNEDEFFVTFCGKEPLLNFFTIESIIEKYINYKNVKFSFTTNGVLNNDYMKHKIKHWVNINKLSMSLSLDGNKEIHNTYRDNSYNNIDLQFYLSVNSKIKTTISPKTISNLYNSIKHIYSLGFKDINTNIAEGN